MSYHAQKGYVYGHVTVLKFCCLLWCNASRGFVSDNDNVITDVLSSLTVNES